MTIGIEAIKMLQVILTVSLKSTGQREGPVEQDAHCQNDPRSRKTRGPR